MRTGRGEVGAGEDCLDGGAVRRGPLIPSRAYWWLKSSCGDLERVTTSGGRSSKESVVAGMAGMVTMIVVPLFGTDPSSSLPPMSSVKFLDITRPRP